MSTAWTKPLDSGTLQTTVLPCATFEPKHPMALPPWYPFPFRVPKLIAFLFLLLGTPTLAAELELDPGNGMQHVTTQTLLARPDLRRIDIPADVAYHQPMQYQAIPLQALLPGLSTGDHLQVVALDGFAAEIPAGKVTEGHGSQAWLAIEDPAAPWPPLGPGKAGAGPFYIVWTDPGIDRISPEYWPYQIAAIRRSEPISARFPAMLPEASLPEDAPARRGFAVFQSHCMACHTLNGEGDAKLGPDLNIPHSPIEYLGAAFLRRYIRDPQSLRHWPQAKMSGFDEQALPDSELDDLMAYLRERATHRSSDTHSPP